MSHIVNIADFGLGANEEKDGTWSVFQAIQYCKQLKDPVLLFPKGRYNFWPDKAFEKTYFISNHDGPALRRCVFPLMGIEGLTVDGQGSEFIFHGLVIPFAVDSSRHIKLQNFSVDWVRPMHSQGIIKKVSGDAVDVSISEEFPYKVTNDKLYFTGEGWEEQVWALIEMDQVKVSPAYQSGDYCLGRPVDSFKVEELQLGLVRFTGHLDRKPAEGNVLVMRHNQRSNPCIFVINSSNIAVESVDIYHCGGMGFISQRSTDIYLNRLNIKRHTASKRFFTTFADAVHFSGCRGRILVENCLFENQLDDALNVHGIYAKIIEVLSRDRIMVKLMHKEQLGVCMAASGDVMSFVCNRTLLSYDTGIVKSVTYLNSEYSVLEFMDSVPQNISPDDVVENTTWVPDLTVRCCMARGNRARGFLITTPGEVLIENNKINVPGAAVKISGDANFWFESGPVKNITIRNNVFEDCNFCYGDWGRAVIDIDPEIAELEESRGYYHKNICIEGNHFKTFNIGIVKGHSVDGFFFQKNIIETTDTYPCHDGVEYRLELHKFRDVKIEDNSWGEYEKTVLVE